MKSKLFDYVERDNFIYNLSGLTKIACFLLLTFAVMFSYDIRCILLIMALCLVFFKMSEIKFSQVKAMLGYVAVFLLINVVLTYILSPMYGTEIYGTTHEIFRFNSYLILTQEELLYLITKTMKYASVIPLGMMFLLTTNPSEFAASINRIGISYKGAYAFALTLRYFPDMIRNYNDISLAQQSRGLDLSKKEKLMTRIKNIMNICVPLIFSTLDKIELISNAMDLRGFGKNKKRTWYAAKPLKNSDFGAMLFCGAIFALTLAVSAFINHSRFWNPFL